MGDLDPDAVAADHQLLDDLRHGLDPPVGDQTAALLAAWRDQLRLPPVTDCPIFDQLRDERLLDMTIPDRPDKVLASPDVGQAVPVGGPATLRFGGFDPTADAADLAERIDQGSPCEDRASHELTDDDGVE